MRSRVVQIILLAVLVYSCRKNFESIEGENAVLQAEQDLTIISSDTATESTSSADGRAITMSYWLTSKSYVEGNAPYVVRMNTKNVAKGTVIPYTISGIDSGDISSGKLTGNFVVGENGTDSTTLVLKQDSITGSTDVMKTSVKTISLSVPLNETISATAITSFYLDTISYGDIDVIAPGRGANMFYDKIGLNLPSSSTYTMPFDRDVRYTWWQLQKGQSTYDWSIIDADFKTCISKGQKLSFRVMTLDTDAISWSSTYTGNNKISYPLFLHSQMQAESAKDWTYGGSWIPNWNSPSYLSAWRNFCSALASHINSTSYNGVSFKNVVFHIDVSGFGNYGEFHSYPFINNYPSSAHKLSDASYKSIVDAQTSAFSNFPLVGNINMFVGEMSLYQGWYSLTASNAWGKIGIRNDHFGWTSTFKNDIQNNTRSYNGLSFKNEILNRWKYAPVCGEPMNSASAVTSGGSCAFWNLETEVRTYHASQFSNQNNTGVTSSCLDDNFRRASKASGYRLLVKSGTISGKTVTLNWRNSGIAPAYENWDVYLQVRSGSTIVWSGMTSFKPKFFQPGTTTVTTTLGTSATGSYSLYVIVKDPSGYRKPLVLTNKNRQSDGSYKIGDIKI